MRSMEAAVVALEGCLDELGDDVGRAVFVLLRDLRAGTIDASSARFSARVLLLHVGARVDPTTVEPLIVFLGAVAELPDDERLLDPTPDPDLPVEVALAAAVADPGARGGLRRAVYAGSLHLPVLDVGMEERQVAIQFVPLVVRGCPMIAAFTSRDRMGDLPHLDVDGHELAAICPPGHGIVVNPGAILGGVLDEVEVRCLPHAPSVGLRDCHVDLQPLGDDDRALADTLADLDARGHGPLSAARDAGVVVVAVGGDPPEYAIRRLGAALAAREIVGPLLVPATSPLGKAVVAATGGRR